MKKFMLLILSFILSLAIMAQGQGKNKDKTTGKDKKEKVVNNDKGNSGNDKTKAIEHDNTVWDGTGEKGGGGPKPSKNQPAKVRSSFQRDYPYATNVRWSKYRGDWTASFGNGMFYSTAVYHANGDRKDTRTPIQRRDIPIRIEDIFKRKPATKLESIIKIEVPQRVKDIFRVKTVENGVARFLFYDADGNPVQYDY